MARFYFQALVLLFLFVVKSDCRAGSPVPEAVSGSLEEDVALSCLNLNETDLKSRSRVKWMKYEADNNQMKVIWPTRLQSAKWQAEGTGHSLFLKKLQKPDEGLYKCEIWQGWDMVLARNITLKVKDCKTLPQAVKAAPSTPVQLNCSVSTTPGEQGPLNVSWTMLNGRNFVSVDSTRVEINGTSLAIKSVIPSDSTWYRCNYMLGKTQRCLEINLMVQETDNVFVVTTVPVIATDTQKVTTSEILWTNKKEENNETLNAVVISVILGIIIIAALMGLLIYRRRTAQRATQPPQKRISGYDVDGYETLNLQTSLDPTNQRVNSLYHVEEENLCTFRY